MELNQTRWLTQANHPDLFSGNFRLGSSVVCYGNYAADPVVRSVAGGYLLLTLGCRPRYPKPPPISRHQQTRQGLARIIGGAPLTFLGGAYRLMTLNATAQVVNHETLDRTNVTNINLFDEVGTAASLIGDLDGNGFEDLALVCAKDGRIWYALLPRLRGVERGGGVVILVFR